MNNIKLCNICNENNKFSVRFNIKLACIGPYGNICIKCKSKKNNNRLNKKDYYKKYYLNNSDKIKETDRKRYIKNKILLETYNNF